MIRGFEQHSAQAPRVAPMAAAILSHAALLLVLLRVPHVVIAPMRLPGTALGSHVSLTYLPGRAPEPRSVASLAVRRVAHQIVPAARAVPRTQTMPALSADTASSASSHLDATNGNDALGTGNVNIALAASFPTPKPDLRTLPKGTSGDVVLDIVIDAEGKVASITMSRGLGHGIDETVIATVQGWSFHPATRDGQPVPSEQELHFHYEKA